MARAQAKSRLEIARERMYRELVFECAEHVIATRGSEQATMQEIASEAGISLRTLYATFASKEELFAEVERVRSEEFVAQIRAGIDAAEGPLERLAGGVRGYVEFLLAHPSFLEIHLRDGRAWGLEPRNGAAEGWRAGVGRFAEILKDGMEGGVFYRGDPELMAMLGAAVMQVQFARIGRDAAPQADAITSEILLQLHRLLCPPAAAWRGPS